MSGGVKAKTAIALPSGWDGTVTRSADIYPATFNFSGTYSGGGTWAGVWPDPADWSSSDYEYVWMQYSNYSGSGLQLKIEYDNYRPEVTDYDAYTQEEVTLTDNSGFVGIAINKTLTLSYGNKLGEHKDELASKYIRSIILQNSGTANTSLTVQGIWVGTQAEYLTDIGYDAEKNHVLKVNCGTAESNIWDHKVVYTFASPLTSGKKYTVSAKVCAPDVTRGTNFLFVLPSGTTPKYGEQQQVLSNTFSQISHTFTAGDNNQSVEIEFGFANGDVYIDDVSFIEEGESTNMITNSDFETPLSTAGWTSSQSISQEEKTIGDVRTLGVQKVTIGSTGWATMVAFNPLSVPAEVEAYFAKYDSEKGNVKLTAVTDMYQWGRAVVKGDEGDYYFPQIASDAVTASGDDNGMEISWDGVNAKYGDGSTIYALGKKNDIVGFYLVKSGVQVPNGKPYLEVTSSGAREFIGFDDETTGINEVATSNFQVSGTDVFDLQGRRVAQPTRGLYIVNGKKVIIK